MSITSKPECIQKIKTNTQSRVIGIVGNTQKSELFEVCNKLSIPLAFTVLGILVKLSNLDEIEDTLKNKYGNSEGSIKFVEKDFRELASLLAGLGCSTHVFGEDPDRAIASPLANALKTIISDPFASRFVSLELIRAVWKRNLWTFCECCAVQIGLSTALIHQIHRLVQKVDFLGHSYSRNSSTEKVRSFDCSLDFSLLLLISDMAEEALVFFSENCNISLLQLGRNCEPLIQSLQDSENKQFFSNIDWTLRDSVVRTIHFCRSSTRNDS